VIIGQTFLPTLPPDLINEVSVKLQSFVGDAQMILALMASATMLVGNLLALIQKNIKRMLAYSSVAHAGYFLIGIVSNNADGWSGVIFYSAAYMFMQIGAFVVVSILERNDKKLELTDYNGLRKQHPWLAAMMAIFMFSLAGIPPFAGFPGKYLLFVSAVEAGYTWLTIVAVISTIISMYFYIGLIINMFFNEQEGEPLEAKAGSVKITLAITTIFVILLGIFPGVLINMAKRLF